MATEKKITSRIQQKHDVAANWAKATNFIPKKGEIIIYDAEYNASGEETQAVRFKIGDGSKTVNNLPFAVIDYSSDIETLEQKVANNSTAIGALQENTVPKTRKINNKALSSDITLGAADVGVNETTFPGLKKTGTVTGVKMNGTTKNPSSGVVDLGTVITAHQSIKSLKTDNTESQAVNPNETIAGSGTINLHKVAKTGSYNDLLYTPTIPTNYVTTDTEQEITGKKTVVTPSDTDDSTQIANTAWVRENYQATCYAGRDSGETDTRYFKVASYSTVADYDHVTLVAHLQDVDSPVFSTVNVHCSTSTKAHEPNAYIGVIDNFTHDASKNPFNYYKDRLFVVANYTIGTQGVTFELWLKTTDKYQQTIFKVISQSSRKGTSKKRPWTLYNNVTTESGTTDFSETSSDGRLVVNNNYLYGATVGYLQPQTNNNIDLGASDQRWLNGYITNIQLCKVINGGGGNSLIQQNSDTSGADITVGSNNCPLKLQGKSVRPVYRQSKGSYNNIALQSDIPTFSLSGTTLTITL